MDEDPALKTKMESRIEKIKTLRKQFQPADSLESEPEVVPRIPRNPLAPVISEVLDDSSEDGEPLTMIERLRIFFPESNSREESKEESQKRCLDEDYEIFSKDPELMAVYNYLHELYLIHKPPDPEVHTEENEDDAEEEDQPEPALNKLTELEKTCLKALLGRILPGRTVDALFAYASTKTSYDQEALHNSHYELSQIFSGAAYGMVMDISIGIYVIGAHNHPELNKPEYLEYYQIMRTMRSGSPSTCSIL